MASQPHAQKLAKEGRLGLAVTSFQSNPLLSVRKLAKAYNVPESTLRRRVRGVLPKHETVSPNRKLSLTEEQALVEWILDLNRRGFPALIINI